MTVESRIRDLLARWEEMRRQGQTPSPASLCRDCPEMLPELELRIHELEGGAIMTNADPYRTVDLSETPKQAKPAGSLAAAPRPEAPGVFLPAVPGFEILEVLGIGGMGIVYKARQQWPLVRLVALKMIKDGQFADAEQRSRFHREAAAVAALQHPNIIPIYAFGEYQRLPYFTMELAEGGSLAQKIKAGGAFPAYDAAHLVETLARAMQHAHEKDILHRDLKPANVLLATNGTPKITDFGLAKRLDGGQASSTGGGTLLYMAPEQIDGPADQLGPTVDVYALGGILCELLTGRPAFQGGTFAEVFDKIRDRKRAAEFPDNPNVPVPRDLEAICLKCLAKDPDRRYASAKALALDIHSGRQGQQTVAWAEGFGKRKSRTVAILPPKPPGTEATDWATRAGFEVRRSLGWRGPCHRRLLARSLAWDRDVVLKVIHPENNEQLRRDFFHEAAVVARLRHPNIPEFLGTGEKDGRLYLIFEYIDGNTLHDLLKLRPLSVREAVQLMKTLAEVIHFAHEEGVVHRDLKPRNILCGHTGIVKVKDLGLPRPMSEPAGAAASSPELMGYTAPEQGSDEGAMDPAMNIYSLGVILYEMLAGRRPGLTARPGPKHGLSGWQAPSNQRSAAKVYSWGARLYEIVAGKRPAPQARPEPEAEPRSSWQPPSSQRPGVTPALDQICFRCLQWDPRERFPTAEALAKELGAALPPSSKSGAKPSPSGGPG